MPAVRAAVVTALVSVAVLSGCQEEEGPPLPADSSGAASPSATPTDSTPTEGAGPSDGASPADGARRVVDAATAGGLAKVTGQDGVSDLVIDPGEMRDGMNLVMNNYSGAGFDGAGRYVLAVAVDRVPEETTERREHLWRGMLDHIQWDAALGQPTAEPVADPGPLGGSVECMLASLAEDGNVICGWADEDTAGVALFPDSDLPEASRLFVAMRGDLER
ncbi:hypothetical protein GCM10027168_40380 [Streptomyces capparidis]